MNVVLAALSGLLLLLIHPDANLYWLAPVALAPLFLVIQRADSAKRRFLLGWLSGVLYWGGMCYWIQGTLFRHGGMNFATSCGVFALFALAKGLHTAVFVALRPRHPLAFALLWAGLERTHATFGFPWLTLGDAGVDSLLASVAPVTGVYGISFVLALAAAWLAQRRWVAAVVFAAFLVPPFSGDTGRLFAWSVQPNFDEEAPPRDPAGKLIALSEGATGAALVLWPEMPVGLYYEQDSMLRMRMVELTRRLQAPLIAGTVSFASLTEPRNAAQFVGVDGVAVARYDKMNLVPFGEFVPWPFNTFIEKVSTETGVFTAGERLVTPRLNGMAVGAFICYESAFPHHVRQFALAGAEVLVNLTNDGYFARSAARGQHLALGRMRAMESDRWVLRSTNDGYTVSIDPRGRVHDEAPAYEARGVRLRFDRRQTLTPYVRWGDWFAWGCLAAGLALVARSPR